MHTPDPVAPLIKELADALRTAVIDAAKAAKDDQTKALADIEASAEWQLLGQADRESILAASGLSSVDSPSVGSDEELLRSLDSMPLSAWGERRQAVPAKVAAVRQSAGKKLEPKSVAVSAPAATLRTEAEVDTFLAELRERLVHHIAIGETVII